MLIISTWLWGNKYDRKYVDRLREGVARNMKGRYNWRVFSPDPADEYLTKIRGCFCRLRAFDRAWQDKQGIEPGDKLVCIDLDTVVTGPLDDLFLGTQDFTILEGANASNPCRFNGSIWMLRAGQREDVWADFSLEAARKIRFFEFPDDQAWFEHKFPGVTGWKVGAESGVYAFKKPGWPKGDDLPSDARLVAFPGWRDPAKFSHLEWIKMNWRIESLERVD